MEGRKKRERYTNFTIVVHLLDLDGDRSVHTTQQKAMEHYLNEWVRAGDLIHDVERSIVESNLDDKTKDVMTEFVLEGVIPNHKVDFEAYLSKCEDVCFYYELEMTGEMDLEFLLKWVDLRLCNIS